MDRVHVMQLVQSFQLGQITRRTFLRRAGVALGSTALASSLLTACANVPLNAPPPGPVPMDQAEPEPEATATVMAESGDEVEVTSGGVEYMAADGETTLMGFLARPAGDGEYPAVIVIQEWWGLNEHIKDVTRRVAAEGYVALAPDLYNGAVALEPDEARRLVMELDMPNAVSDIEAATTYVLGEEGVSSEKAGIVGFCLGGRLVLMAALASDNLGAAVAFYGNPLTPEEVVNIKAPLQGHYGTEDGGIPVEGVEAMFGGLEGTDIANEVYIYEGAPHAFFNDTRESSYRPQAAADAWTRTLSWFETYL